MSPLISIVMPVFETESYLGEALQGILQQDYPTWELLVILDGGPEADQASWWQSSYPDSRIRWLISSRNRGLTRSRNLGIRCAKGPWLAFCDSDDVWRPDKLSAQWKEAQRGGYNVLGTGFAFMRQLSTADPDNAGRYWLKRAILPSTLNYATLRATNALPMSSAMYHAEVLSKYYFQNAGSPDLIHEDYAYWLNLFANPKVKSTLLHRTMLGIRIRSQSRSSNKIKAMRAHAAILGEHLGSGLWSRLRVLAYLMQYSYWAIRKRSGPWRPSQEFDWHP